MHGIGGKREGKRRGLMEYIGSFDATVRLWDCKSQSMKPIQVLEDAKDSVSSLHVVGHEIVTGSVDGRMRIYDLRMGMVFVDVIGRMSTYLSPPCYDPCHHRLLTNGACVHTEPITSVTQTRDANAVLVSTLDSTIRLMDKGNGQLLQSYRGHTNKDYRIRSTLGMADSIVISGSEDGKLFAWDVLEGKVNQEIDGAHGGKVASAVAVNGVKKEWASAGVDSECWSLRLGWEFLLMLDICRHCLCLGHA
jgi:mitogen-activated protein kinase organizer 1